MKKQNIFKSSRRKFLLAGLATTALNGVFITFNLDIKILNYYYLIIQITINYTI